MIELQHANHCVYRIRYHMVLCVKYRKKLLSDSKKIIWLKEICSEIGERYWFQFEAIGTDGDHVHIFVGSEPKFAPSRVMQIIKRITAKQILRIFRKPGKNFGAANFGVMADILVQLVKV